jgi:Flp pilus assembly protein TadG
MRILRDEDGQTLVMTALCATVLIGFMGLAVDVGVAYHAKRNLQTAADDAAIAAALNYQYVASGDPTAAAKAAAAKNGVDGSYVTVLASPTVGYHQGLGFFDVRVVQPQVAFLATVLNMPQIRVGARAVAGVTPGSSCMYVLNTKDADSFKVKGNATVTTTGCGIQVNSLSSSAFCDQGSATIAASYVRLAGGQDTGGGCNKAPGATVFSGYPTQSDPFGSKTFPKLTDCSSTNGDLITVSGSTAITSSTSGLSTTYKSFTAGDGTTYKLTCFNNTSSGGSPVVLDGSTTPLVLGTVGQGQIFLFENGVTIKGSVTVNGTIDNYQGTFDNQNGQLKITAPASKTLTYNSLALVQPDTNTTGSCQDGSLNSYQGSFSPKPTCLQAQFGSTGEDLDGYIYAPKSVTYLQDQGGGVTAGGVISLDVYINSQLTLKNSYNSMHPSTTPLSKVALVE